jgi:hypothetical protein
MLRRDTQCTWDGLFVAFSLVNIRNSCVVALPDNWFSGDSTSLVTAAGSNGLCNTIYSVDPTALPGENHFTGLYIN